MLALKQIGAALLSLSIFSNCTNNIGEKNSVSIESNNSMEWSDQSIKVLELFTSEGCSSCPPADRLMQKVVAQNEADVFVLTYHVDYWNRLGWKDSFSSSAFTNRQKVYAAHFNNQSIYTPQLVINGDVEFTGSDEQRLNTELKKSQAQLAESKTNLDIELISYNQSTIELRYNLAGSKNQNINVAFVQGEAVTSVKRGENAGKSLKHVNIVKKLYTAPLKTGTQDLSINVEQLNLNNLFLIVFAQDKDDLAITHARKMAIKNQ